MPIESIDRPSLRRLVKKGDYTSALKALVEAYVNYVNQVYRGDRSQSMSRRWIDAFTSQVSTSNKLPLSTALNEYAERLQASVEKSTLEDAVSVIASASLEVGRVFADENRFSLHQTSKAISNAWYRFNYELLLYQNADNKEDALRDVYDLIPRVGRILGGGKDEFKEAEKKK